MKILYSEKFQYGFKIYFTHFNKMKIARKMQNSLLKDLEKL